MSGVPTDLARSRSRRNRVAYLALLRRSSEYALRSWVVRVCALATVAVVALTSASFVLVLAMCVVPAIGCSLLYTNERHLAQGTRPRTWLGRVYARNIERTNGQHRLSLGSYFDLGGSFLLIAAPSWVATDTPLVLRLVMLAAGVSFFVSSVLLIFNDHTWFNPDERHPPRWHELARTAAGPITVALAAAITLPADWGLRGEYAAIVICLTAFTVSFRIGDTAVIMKYLAPLVREESDAGREAVVSATHGALSTHLRLLEQQARAVRDTNPALYELAVSANSRLRETLSRTSADGLEDGDLTALAAPVLTLARAVGARAVVEVSLTTLSLADHDLVRLVLSDLVGNALNAGAADVAVRAGSVEGQIVVAVDDDAPPMPDGAWQSAGTTSARLAHRLGELGGGLRVVQGEAGKTVTAAWDPRT